MGRRSNKGRVERPKIVPLDMDGGKAARTSRTRHLLPGNPDLSRSRRPPIPARALQRVIAAAWQSLLQWRLDHDGPMA